MGTLIRWLLGFLSGGAGQVVGKTVNTVGTLALLAPLAVWFLGAKDEVALSVTWGQLALFALLLWFVVKVVHYTPAPRYSPPQQYQPPLPPL